MAPEADLSAYAQPAQTSISPYLIMAAQKEAATGQPGQAVAQLGAAGLQAKHPAALAGAQKATMSARAPASPQPTPASPQAPAQAGGVAGGEGPTQAQVGGGAPSLGVNGGIGPSPALAQLAQSLKDNPSAAPGAQPKQADILSQIQDAIAKRKAAGDPKRAVDLTGLMMLADSTNDTNRFSQAYKGAQEHEEQGIKDKQAADQQNIEDLGKLYNPYKQSTQTNQSLQSIMQNSREDFKAIQADDTEAAKVTALVNSHNPGATPAIKEALTRLMTGARPQMAMIEQQAQDPSIGQRMETWLSMAENGQLPVENVAQMNQLVADINRVNSAKRKGALERTLNYAQARGVDRDTAMGLVPSEWTNPNAGLATQATSLGATSQKVKAGKADAKAAASYDPDVIAYAQKHGISPDYAKQLKAERTAQ